MWRNTHVEEHALLRVLDQVARRAQPPDVKFI